MRHLPPAERALHAYIRFALTHRVWLVAVAFLVAILFAALTPRVTFDNTTDSFFMEGDRTLEVYRKFKTLFQSDEYSLITLDAPETWTPGFVDTVRGLVRELEALPHVLRVTAITNVRHIEGDEDRLEVGDFLPEGLTAAQILAREAEARVHPYYAELYLTADARHLGIVVETQIIPGQINYKIALTAAIRELLEQPRYAAWNPHAVGAPILDADVRMIVGYESKLFGAIVFALVGVGFLLVFRSWVGIVMPLTIASLAIVVAFGTMALIGAPVTILTPIVPSFLLSVGVGSCVFLMTEFYSVSIQRRIAAEALEEALPRAGLPAIMGGLTTAAALLAFSSSKIKPVMDIGITMGVALLAALMFTFLLMPLALGARRVVRLSPVRDRRIMGRVRALDMVCGFVLRRWRLVLVVFTALLVAGAYGVWQLRADYYYLGTFKESTRIRVDYAYADAILPASSAIEVLVKAPTLDGFKEPAALHALDELKARIEATRYLPAKTYTLSDVLKEINQAIHAGDPAAYRVPDSRAAVAQALLLFESTGHDELTRVTVPDYDVARLTVRVPNLSDDAYAPLIAAIERAAADLFAPDKGLAGYQVEITGLVSMWIRISDYLAQSQISSMLISFLVVTVVMVAVFRSLILGLLMSAMNAVVVMLTLGAMGFLGINLDPYIILVGAIAIGVLDDDTMHFVTHIQHALREGKSLPDAIRHSYLCAGQAMFYLAAVLVTAFAAYTLSQVGSLARFGLLFGATIVLGLIVELFVTPAVLLLADRLGWLERQPQLAASAAAALALACLPAASAAVAQDTGTAPVPVDKKLSLVLAPHYATGSSDLDNRRYLIGGTAFITGELGGEAWRAYLDSQPQISDLDDRREPRPAGRRTILP